jgi:polyisoprenoid-binding protein YceI
MKKNLFLASLFLLFSASSFAQTYTIDPSHTYPSFEADHKGISYWRGKFTKTTGTVTLDRVAKTGTINIEIDANSVDFGHEKMSAHAKKPDMFNVEKFPTIKYAAKNIKFDGDTPSSVEGELTLLGVTKPVILTIRKFKCIMDGMSKRELCGADAVAEFKRSDFGLDYGLNWGFAPEVKLQIQVEAMRAQ